MRYEKERIEITQVVEVVVGEQTRLYDTALITYHLENRDDKEHTVGLRVMLDTYIGANAGPSVYIPPTDNEPKARVVDTKAELSRKEAPPFIRILESDKLDDANATVAEMGLQLKGLELLDKLVICRWPQEWGASEARWEWPFTAINDPKDKPKSSCVVLYWAKQNMKPDEKRHCGFCYGLGRISDARRSVQAAARSADTPKLSDDPAILVKEAALQQKEAFAAVDSLRKDLVVLEQRETAAGTRERAQNGLFLRGIQATLKASDVDANFAKTDEILGAAKIPGLREITELIEEGKELTVSSTSS